jgi:DNA-binding PadR family transcriptional regulator
MESRVANQRPDGPISLTEPMHLILLSLLRGDRHGYAIMQDVDTISGGSVAMGPGTLYGAIKRLLRARLILETKERPHSDEDDERRRYYRISDAGKDAVKRETERLRRIVNFARKQLA